VNALIAGSGVTVNNTTIEIEPVHPKAKWK